MAMSHLAKEEMSESYTETGRNWGHVHLGSREQSTVQNCLKLSCPGSLREVVILAKIDIWSLLSEYSPSSICLLQWEPRAFQMLLRWFE